MASILDKLDSLGDEHPHKLLYSYLDLNGNPLEGYTYASFIQRTKATVSYTHLDVYKRQELIRIVSESTMITVPGPCVPLDTLNAQDPLSSAPDVIVPVETTALSEDGITSSAWSATSIGSDGL